MIKISLCMGFYLDTPVKYYGCKFDAPIPPKVRPRFAQSPPKPAPRAACCHAGVQLKILNLLTTLLLQIVTILLRFCDVFVTFLFFITLTKWQTTLIHSVIHDILSPVIMSCINCHYVTCLYHK